MSTSGSSGRSRSRSPAACGTAAATTGPDAGLDVDPEPDRRDGRHDVGVQDGRVHAVAANRLQGDLGGQVGVADGGEDRSRSRGRPEYSGSERPAWRMNQTGMRSVASPDTLPGTGSRGGGRTSVPSQPRVPSPPTDGRPARRGRDDPEAPCDAASTTIRSRSPHCRRTTQPTWPRSTGPCRSVTTTWMPVSACRCSSRRSARCATRRWRTSTRTGSAGSAWRSRSALVELGEDPGR